MTSVCDIYFEWTCSSYLSPCPSNLQRTLYEHRTSHRTNPYYKAKMPSQRQAVHATNAPKPNGNYSHVIRQGNILHVAGWMGDDPESGKIVPGGIEAQTVCSILPITISVFERTISPISFLSLGYPDTRYTCISITAYDYTRNAQSSTYKPASKLLAQI